MPRMQSSHLQCSGSLLNPLAWLQLESTDWIELERMNVVEAWQKHFCQNVRRRRQRDISSEIPVLGAIQNICTFKRF
jgi:hypothetical protein